MSKLDATSGLSSNQIHIIKGAIKRDLARRLPELPHPVETRLYFEGREAWTYSWRLLGQDAQKPMGSLLLEVDVKLKKEFTQYQIRPRYTFSCHVQLQSDIYSPVIAIYEKSS